MKKVIWKFPLVSEKIKIPRDAEVLCVQMQNKVPTMWAIVDPKAPLEERTFYSVATGGTVERNEDGVPFGDDYYHGTLQIDEFVIHIFEKV